MSNRVQCQAAFERRLNDTAGEDGWQRHLTTCNDCRAEARDLEKLMTPLRDAEPPPENYARLAVLEDHLLAAIRQEAEPVHDEPATDRPERTHWLSYGAIAAGALLLVGSAWLALGWIGNRNVGNDDHRVAHEIASPPRKEAPPRATARVLPLSITVTTGRILHRDTNGSTGNTPPARLSPGAELETIGDQTVVVLETPARDLLLRLGPRSRLRRLEGKERWFRLERGELMADVRSQSAGGSLRIHTPRGTVTVRGTRFLVQATATKTLVTVFRGQVHYRSRLAGERLLSAGYRLEDHASGMTVRAIQAPVPTPRMKPRSVSMGSSRHNAHAIRQPRQGCLKRVRQLLRKGRVTAARSTIAACRKAGVHSTTSTVLKMLDAQALLALGKVTGAVRAYHHIARQHRSSRLGQNALFTAGQLELSRLGQTKRALATFKRYLKAYPSGRYASEARQLVRTLEAGK